MVKKRCLKRYIKRDLFLQMKSSYVLTHFSDPEYGSILKYVLLFFITVLYELHNIYYASLCDHFFALHGQMYHANRHNSASYMQYQAIIIIYFNTKKSTTK